MSKWEYKAIKKSDNYLRESYFYKDRFYGTGYPGTRVPPPFSKYYIEIDGWIPLSGLKYGADDQSARTIAMGDNGSIFVVYQGFTDELYGYKLVVEHNPQTGSDTVYRGRIDPHIKDYHWSTSKGNERYGTDGRFIYAFGGTYFSRDIDGWVDERRVLRFDTTTGETIVMPNIITDVLDVRDTFSFQDSNNNPKILLYSRGENTSTYMYDVNSNTIKVETNTPTPFTDCVKHKDELIFINYYDIAMYAYNLNTKAWRGLEDVPEDIKVQLPGGRGNFNNIGIYENKIQIGGFGSWPHGILTYQLDATTVMNCSPTSGFINEHTENEFSWEIVAFPEDTGQHSGLFQWRALGSAVVQQVNLGAVQSVIIPKNTFPNGSIQWRVQVTSTANIVSDWTEWFTLTTQDVKHGAPTQLRPNSGRYNATEMIQFSWLCNSPLATPQKGFVLDVNYTNDDSRWERLNTNTNTTVPSFTAAGNMLKPDRITGLVRWRVATMNSDGVYSDFSVPAVFTALTAPAPPEWISVEQNKARPNCRWVSGIGQIGWRLRIRRGSEIIYDTGERQGNTTEYKIPEYLANGVYIFEVMIHTEIQLWSKWSERTVSISARGRIRIVLEGSQIENGVELKIVSKEVTT